MNQATIFVPGTMGTELFAADGERLWPPKPLETQFGYRRVDKLLADDVRVGGIIEKVACFDFYGSLLAQFADLGFEDAGARRLYLFPYDWRLDLEITARQLAALIDKVHGEGAREILLVAHSMGGLVVRLVLESGAYADRPWFGLIDSFIAMATPHQGAPLALARVLGLDSTLGISRSDFRRLTGDPCYPSAYQLLPAPSEEACWNQSDLSLRVVDIYDETTASRLGLNLQLLARARFVHDTLAKHARPLHVRYFFFAGAGHETVTRVNVAERGDAFPVEEMVVTRVDDAGDGTVPSWSALPLTGQKQLVINEHSQVFRGMPFKRVFYRLLGGDLGPALEALPKNERDALPIEERGRLTLSIPTPIIECGNDFELLLVPAVPADRIEGAFVLSRLTDDGQPLPGSAEPLDTLAYHGPTVSRLRLRMRPVARPGPYQLVFEGAPETSEPLTFAVVSLPQE